MSYAQTINRKFGEKHGGQPTGQQPANPRKRQGQHARNFAQGVVPIARKPMGHAKTYKVILQRLMKFTTDLDAENKREARKTALQAVIPFPVN